MNVERLVVSGRGLRFEAGVNDVPLVRSARGEPVAAALPLELWLLPSGNRMTAQAQRLADSRREPALDVSIVRPDDPDPECMRVHWSAPEDLAFDPFDVCVPFTTDGPPPESRAWREAARMDSLDDEAIRGARGAGAALLAAFGKGTEAVLETLAFRIEDEARVLGEEPDAVRARVSALVGRILLRRGPAPIAAGDVQTRLVAGGRAVMLTSGGAELVWSEGASMPVFVSCVGGAWTVTR